MKHSDAGDTKWEATAEVISENARGRSARGGKKDGGGGVVNVSREKREALIHEDKNGDEGGKRKRSKREAQTTASQIQGGGTL